MEILRKKADIHIELRWTDEYIYAEGKNKGLVELQHGNLLFITDLKDALKYTIKELKKRLKIDKPIDFRLRTHGFIAHIDYDNGMFNVIIIIRPLTKKYKYWLRMPEQEIYNFVNAFFGSADDLSEYLLNKNSTEVMLSTDFCMITEFPSSVAFVLENGGNVGIHTWIECSNEGCETGYFSPEPYVGKIEKVV